MAKPTIGPGKEFFSQWHLDRYVVDKKRELAGAVARGDDATAEECRSELERLDPQPKPQKK